MRVLCCLVLLACSVGLADAQLSVGDIAIVAFNTHDPDNFAWVPLRNIPPNTTICFTDSSVSNGCLRWTEHFSPITGTPGPLTWTSRSYLLAGTVVRWEGGSLTNWTLGEATGAGPGLSQAGDQLFAYVGEIAHNAAQPNPWNGDPTNATFLYGLNFANAGWNNQTGGSPETSFVPPGLSTNAYTAAHVNSKPDGYYSGTLKGTPDQLRRALANSTNWTTGSSAFNASNWPASFRVLGIRRGTVLSVQ